MKQISWIMVAGIFGALGIAIGAFGAHGLPTWLGERGFAPEEVTKRLETFETGARYHMYAAITLLGVGLAAHVAPTRKWSTAAWLLFTGSIIFSGLLYVIALAGDDWRWLGMIVPVGGLLQIAGWAMIAAAAAFAANRQSVPV